MSEHAIKQITANKKKHARGGDARVLDIGNCGLTTMPDLSDLFWLETLIVSDRWWDWKRRRWIGSGNGGRSNQLICELKNCLPKSLVSLHLDGDSNNLWNSVWGSSSFGSLKVLGKQQLSPQSNNQITSWDFLKELPSLQSLSLGNNQISNWDFLKELTSLRYLSLSNNQIKDLSFLEGLSKLIALNLMDNLIIDGDFLKGFKNLHTLNISSNQINNLHFLKGLTNLQFLDLSKNQINTLDYLRGLHDLRYLDLSYNDINNGDPLKGLTNLHTLYLSSNQITNIAFLKESKNLQSIDLSYNQISEIDPILKLIKQGIPISNKRFSPFNSINLRNNPITHPPLEIVAQGNEAILRYFEDLEKEGSDQIYEAKLLLIGEGGAGKTSLCRKLFDPRAELPEEKDRTQGIDIHPLHFEVPDVADKQFRLNIWDFAGQGKYQSAHSFFYTHRSLYVLVDDTRTLNENEAYRTLYNNWLQTAELFGGQSPVLVLHNEKEGCARTGFSIASFKERFDFVYGELFRINLGGAEIAKIEDLKRQIERQALQLPHIGDVVPKTWVKVREAIETEREKHPYISYDRYREICETAGIADPKRQSDLSQYFHDLGVFLHFPKNPLLRRDVFLQNEWVTAAVYKILDDQQIAGPQRGRFDKGDLARIWHESSYRHRLDELLALMEQFELCYQVLGSDKYVCPQLLPGDTPAYELGAEIPLQLKYEYGFMPKGLLYRLIVRLHRHIANGQSAVWNSGVVLERMGSKADILESLDRRTISVRATGPRAKELITIVHDAMEGLHEPFGERLRVSVKIPCNCSVCKESATPHFYDKSDLDTRILKGKTTVECRVSYEDVLVLGLLDGVFGAVLRSFKEDVVDWLKEGEIEKALSELKLSGVQDADGLLASYKTAQKEYLAGRIDFKEYEKVCNRVIEGVRQLIR